MDVLNGRNDDGDMRGHLRRNAVKALALIAVLGVSLFGYYRHRETQLRLPPAHSVAGPVAVTQGPQSPASSKLVSSGTPSQRGTHTQWSNKYFRTEDYFDFVSRAARAAYDGDGRAAHYVADALTACILVSTMVRTNPDAETEYRRQFVDLPNAPQWVRDVNLKKFSRCEHLGKGDPFQDLPPGKGDYQSPGYWRERALSDGDSLALAQRAARELAQVADATGNRRDIIEHAQADVATSMNSADPESMFSIGSLLGNGRYTRDITRGIAIALAACDLGYDCSAANPENTFAGCKDSGACPADADYAYFVEQGMGEKAYAQAYAQAQEFKDALVRRDQEEIRKFITIDGEF